MKTRVRILMAGWIFYSVAIGIIAVRSNIEKSEAEEELERLAAGGIHPRVSAREVIQLAESKSAANGEVVQSAEIGGASNNINHIEQAVILGEGPFSEWWGLIEGLVQIDGAKCAKKVTSLPKSEDRTRGLQLVFQHWGAKDYEEAKAWMEENLPPEENLFFQDRLLAGLISVDPQKAKSELMNVTSPIIKHRLSLSLAERLYSDDPYQAEAWVISSLSPIQAAQGLGSLGRKWLHEGNVNEAIRILDEMAYGTSRNHLIRSIGKKFFRSDSNEALKWMDSLSEADRGFATHSVVGEWAKDSPEEAANYVLGRDPRNISGVATALSTWARTSPEEAVAWVKNNIDEKMHNKDLMGKIFHQWGINDPSNAASYLLGIKEGGERAHYLNLITTSWVSRDPAAAGEFLAAVDGADGRMAVKLLVRGWSSLDSMSASKWVEGLEPGANYDIAAAALANTITSAEPVASAKWANAIGEAEQRRNALSQVFEELGHRDPKKAMEISEDIQLAPGERSIVEEAIRRATDIR